MPDPVDLSVFKPNDADELFDAIWTQITGVVIDDLQSFKKEIEPMLRSIATKAVRTAGMLAAGQISREDADLALHTQELALSSVLLYSAFMTYVLAQGVLDAVFTVISAAIKNLTGIELSF
ncbi:hypothetical protein [Brevundimonas sp.]|uniref:hypothetical protein n=1 Tax=Brevundimonas sp. TaxID=1871086 RepID=UPI002ABCEA0E|nr:hypothetical protein [Brevundimonas sp.]MDZ4363074.1 hypothetical protein [Brevundimonas sp.]